MVFLDKPHIKQFTDIFDTSLKNIFIFKIYIYFYLLSLYKLSIHYLSYSYITVNNVFSNNFFLSINMILSVVSFIIIYQNYYFYPTNKISTTIFSLTNANAYISFLIKMYDHLFIISFEIITNIILLSIVIYTISYRSETFILNKLFYIISPLYLTGIFIIQHFQMVTNRQFAYLFIFSIIFIIIHLQNIKILVKRYMSKDLYLAYLNFYFILIDIIDILINVIIDIFFRNYNRKKRL